MRYWKLLFLVFFLYSVPLYAQNTTISSFSKAKKILKEQVYFDNKESFYCKAHFDENNGITLPQGFHTQKHKKRAYKLEWEHVVPAENFGRAFSEWREGHEKCIDRKGKAFKGRRCAEKVNQSFRFMQADLYNLYPSIGAVNALRSNYNYAELSDNLPNIFGSCSVKIDNKKIEPPSYTKGAIARTYLYFDQEYPQYKMSSSMRKMMLAWNTMYPVDQWECIRTKRIENIQGNPNNFVKEKCIELGLYQLPITSKTKLVMKQ